MKKMYNIFFATLIGITSSVFPSHASSITTEATYLAMTIFGRKSIQFQHCLNDYKNTHFLFSTVIQKQEYFSEKIKKQAPKAEIIRPSDETEINWQNCLNLAQSSAKNQIANLIQTKKTKARKQPEEELASILQNIKEEK